MQKRILPAFITAAVTVIITISACTKIDTTTLGADALQVDNIHTFLDSVTITASQFTMLDSTLINKSDNYIIGNIDGTGADPLFGKTNASIYAEFKPTFYPYYFGNAGDIVKGAAGTGFDSAVVTFSYKEAWGDTASGTVTPQKFEVYAVGPDADFYNKIDTVRPLAYQPVVNTGTLLGSAMITPQSIAQKVVFNQNTDSVDTQIRIPINTVAGIAKFKALFENQDSSVNGVNNAFYNDTKYTTFAASAQFGLAIKVNGNGNTLYYVNMTETKTRLEFFYRKKVNATAPTTFGVSYFRMYPTTLTDLASASPCANSVRRDYSGSPAATPTVGQLFLQTSPAPVCFANIKLPGLTGYSNRIVHRAYLAVEQIPGNSYYDKIYPAPDYLYLDLRDNTVATTVFKPVYFDLSTTYAYNPDATVANGLYHPYPVSNVSISNFGGNAIQKYDASGTPYTRYEINITRYIQHVITNGYNNYDLRLFAPYSYYYPQYLGNQYIIPYYNSLAKGRVRIGDPSSPVHTMKFYIVYSKI